MQLENLRQFDIYLKFYLFCVNYKKNFNLTCISKQSNNIFFVLIILKKFAQINYKNFIYLNFSMNMTINFNYN
jgi:hypothetical protein